MPYKVPISKKEQYDSMEFEELLDARNTLAFRTYYLSRPAGVYKTELVQRSGPTGDAYVTDSRVVEPMREEILRELVNELIYVDKRLFKKNFGARDAGASRYYPWLGKGRKIRRSQ